MTVHGERAVIPAVSGKAEAEKVLRRFTDGYNDAYRKLDPALVDRVETGAPAEIARADLAAQRAVTPGGNPGYPPLVLDDARFTIPKMAGWPKFFVADTRSNRDRHRWLLVFTRADAGRPWKAAYLSLLNQGSVPEFALDKDGYAQAVPAKDDKGSAPLAVRPDALSAAYTDFLRTGTGGVFAPGTSTTQIRADRAKLARTPTFWAEYIDTPTSAPDFPAPALRTKDGGALAFFTAHHRERRTAVAGVRPEVTDPRTKALLKGDLKQAVTYTRVSESAVAIPGKGAVVFLNRIESLTGAKGE
ncbi:hypothetical protein K6I33_006571 [Streptomyces sp. UNOB3_S3]|nr:hypothetical protein [Streptomyces sp. UNOB3_S3]